jgi:hypothetical protein
LVFPTADRTCRGGGTRNKKIRKRSVKCGKAHALVIFPVFDDEPEASLL